VVNHGTARNRGASGSGRARAQRVRQLRAQGEWRIAPRPFMRPAEEAIRGRVNEALAQAVAEATT
jgi:hypothetical protein